MVKKPFDSPGDCKYKGGVLKGASKPKDVYPPLSEEEQKKVDGWMSKPLEPWEECSDVWPTEAAYFNWIRGAMRKAWCRHPVKVSYMNKHRFKAPLGRVTFKHPEGTPVWATHCETCKKIFKVGLTEVDHIVRAGGCKSWEEFYPWIKSLLHINHESLAIICKTCHRIKSYAEQHDLTFEEAKLAKKVIAFMKQKASFQTRCLHSYGFDVSKITNAKMRKAAYTWHLKSKESK